MFSFLKKTTILFKTRVLFVDQKFNLNFHQYTSKKEFGFLSTFEAVKSN